MGTMVPRHILQGFCSLLLKFMLRHGTKRDHDKMFNFLGDLVVGTLSLSFGLGSKDDIYFLAQELFNVNGVTLKEQDPKLRISHTDQ